MHIQDKQNSKQQKGSRMSQKYRNEEKNDETTRAMIFFFSIVRILHNPYTTT